MPWTNWGTQIAITKATIGSLTQADSIATFGASGAIRAAILVGLIKAAVGAAKGIISKNLYTGGYTGPGGMYEPAGVVHKGEYVVPAWMVSNPQIEQVLQALESQRQAGIPGFAVGGGAGVNLSGSSTTGSNSTLIGSDPELKKLIAQNIMINQKLLTNGVKQNWPWQEIDNMRKGMGKLEDIENSVSP